MYSHISELNGAFNSVAHYVAQAPFNNWEGYNAQHDGLSFTPFGNGLAQPRFYPGQWGPCSVTCGPGISTRAVECVAVQGLTSKVIKLPEYECEGSQKPSLFQPCQIRQCPLSESVDEPPTRETQLISSRKQKSTLKCIDETRKTAVAWSFCDAKQRPIDISRSCNNNPCPPEWSIGKMSECSHTCGGGLRSRKVRCIRRISRAGNPESTLILPDSQCPYPKPQDTEACGFVDCPIAWKVSQWSQCSASCDAGEQRRDVVCEQRTADGQIHKYSPPTPCKNLEKPPTIQICNLGNLIVRSCDRETPLSLLSKDVEQQHKHHRKLTFNIGGHANLYQGTSIKVKCPVRNFTKSNIQWMKDGRIISNNAHTKVSTNGALRIFHARMEDAGVYTCLAGDVQGNVTLAFKPRDSTKVAFIKNQEKSNEFQPPISSTLQDSTDILMDKTILEDICISILQRIRESLKNNGDSRMLGKLADIYDPVKIKYYETGIEALNFRLITLLVSGQYAHKTIAVRQLKCRVNYEGSVAYVDNEICDSLGVMRPPSSRSCTLALCPHWEASKWSECTLSRCIRYAISLQKRDVKCLYENGSIANYSQCDRSNRPKVKKECVNLCHDVFFDFRVRLLSLKDRGVDRVNSDANPT
ncbi:unnamed protein product [Dracunculus medinensis]|uniref:Ig-like domain-containing protein n=1 Tax=Dracunculus medinensis TaxID=318479 RepID=A0A158Q3Y1_DRAME|nr:unnamed protein product [Dracunculus medinensis]